MWKAKVVICVLLEIVAVFGNTCSTHEKGSLSSCYNKDGSVIGKTTLEVRWDPQNITGNHTYSITLQALAAEDGTIFDKGRLNLTVMIPGLDRPLYSKMQNYTCKELVKLFPNNVNICPLNIQTWSSILKLPLTINYTAPAEIPVPMGSYHVIAALYNEEDTKAFLCVDAWLIFAEIHDDFYACAPTAPPPHDEHLSRNVQFVMDTMLGVQTHKDREMDRL